MLRDVYVFERLLELGLPEREALMWRERQLLEARGQAHRLHAGLAHLVSILTLFRLI